MRVVVTADGADLDSRASPVFGRCLVYCFVETETMALEAVENPARDASGGAGIQAARFVVDRGAQAVLTGNMGPNAFNVLRAASVHVYQVSAGTVRQAVQAFKAGGLPLIGAPNAGAHAGMGRGGGMGRGRGGGMGMGRGAGMAMGPASPAAPAQPAPPTEAADFRAAEIAELKETAGALRKQLAEVLERLDRLEKGQ